MNSIKCKNCGLSNFPNDPECRRCGFSFLRSAKTKDKNPGGFSVWSLLLLALLVGLAYYVYTGTQTSIEQINANQAKRAASQPAEPAAGLSRTEYDRKRAGTYGDAVKNSSSLNAHEQQIRNTEKTMQQISNGQLGK